MSVLHPGLLLAGLLAVAVPIVIHLLLRRRRKPVPWAAMRFLMEAYRRQRSRLQLEQILLLAARCLALACLAFALARPMFNAGAFAGDGGGRDVFIVLDDSLTAQARDAGGETALERSKQLASGLVSGLSPGDRAGLVLMSRPARAVVAPASGDVMAVARLIEQTEVTEARADVGAALQAVAEGVEAERPTTVVIVSEGRSGTFDISTGLGAVFAGNDRVELVLSEPASATVPNRAVAEVRPLRAVAVGGEDVPVRVVIERFGESDRAVVSVSLFAEGPVPIARGEARFAEGADEATAVLSVPSGALGEAEAVPLRVEIDRDALAGDNERLFVLGRSASLVVGVIAPGGIGGGRIDELSQDAWLRFALAPGEEGGIEPRQIDPASVDAPVLSTVSAAAVTRADLLSGPGWAALRGFAEAGGFVLVFPPADARVHGWTDRFVEAFGLGWRPSREVREIEDGIGLEASERAAAGTLSLLGAELGPLTRGVSVRRLLEVEGDASGGTPLLELSDGSPMMVAQQVGSGTVVYSAVALDPEWSDVPLRPVAVPLFQELMRQSSGGAVARRSVTAGDGVELSGAASYTRIGEEAETIGAGEPIRQRGVYAARSIDGRTLGRIAVSPDAAASDTGGLEVASVRRWLARSLGGEGDSAMDRVGVLDADGSAGGVVRSQADAKWSIVLLACALGFMLIETVLGRVFSHARTGDALAGGMS